MQHPENKYVFTKIIYNPSIKLTIINYICNMNHNIYKNSYNVMKNKNKIGYKYKKVMPNI
jgi:hypothetical protein